MHYICLYRLQFDRGDLIYAEIYKLEYVIGFVTDKFYMPSESV